MSIGRAAVRRATLADVAAVARLAAEVAREGRPPEEQLSAPEIAVRLLEELEAGGTVEVAERHRQVIGFAQTGEVMVADGGHVVELVRLYVVPSERRHGVGTALLYGLLEDFDQAVRPTLRAWAAGSSPLERFFVAAGGRRLGPRWRMLGGGRAVRGALYCWEPPCAVRRGAVR